MSKEEKKEQAMSRRKYLSAIGGLTVAAVAGWGVAGYLASQPPSLGAERTVTQTLERTVTVTAGAPPPAGPPFRGITLKVASQAGGSGYACKKWATGWEDATGGKVEVTEIDFESLEPKIMMELTGKTGAFDIVNYCPEWRADIMGTGELVQLDDYIAGKWNDVTHDAELNWDDVLPVVRRNTQFAGQTYAIPNDGDQHFVGFRKDIFENPDNQRKFKDEMRYDLPVTGPETWSQFFDLAKFFNGWDWAGDGQTHYGTAQTCVGWLTQYWIFDYAAASIVKGGEPPSDTNSLYFDTKTMEPLLTTPPFLEAMKFNVKLIDECTPPGQIGWGQAEQRDAWSHGQIAMIVDWPDMRMYVNDPKRSVIKGKVGYCMAPGSNKLYDREKKEWITLSKVNKVGLLAFGGWVLSIAKATKNPDAAFDFLRWMTAHSTEEIMDPNTGWDPHRYSHFDYERNKDLWDKAGAVDAKYALAALLDGLQNGFPTLAIPGTFDYQQTLSTNLGKAYAKELSPEAALKAAYDDWEKITERHGRENQLSYYRKLLGLP